ncbi:MAG: plasmid stabilization protein [Sphingomonas bacterium]|uniref:type II toxin-antitoxin system RelE/ParE family toxin n=1 Tax=Sphingomonas bacterium TaxID=1895847 RepID=UPI0026052A4F|nr:type II toxin-antitoxin system RelE/ParE family toxin [Sphingomonas bacterium]MDB5703236.1 plasmid stabilization protein [Sphingomonas bacterium]
MNAKPVVPREQANRDVEAAIDYYVREAGPDVALAFIDALRDAYQAIGDNPATGSPRFAHELNLPGLRTRKLARYPFLAFYLDRADHIDVWRVLHMQRDIPAWLRDEED